MVESTPSRQRRPPCKTNKEKSDEDADAAALTYLLNSMKTMSTGVGEQGKFHYNPIDRRGILLLCRCEGQGKPMQRK